MVNILNLETKELIFSYEELPELPQEPTEIELLQARISELEKHLNQIQNSINLTNND